jgi:hypothetical protein
MADRREPLLSADGFGTFSVTDLVSEVIGKTANDSVTRRGVGGEKRPDLQDRCPPYPSL